MGVHRPKSVALFVLLALPAVSFAQRTELKPGWNKFSPQDDISLGKRAAVDAEKQLPLCNAPRVDAYLTQLGMRLVQKLPTGGVQYPFEFHCVNDKAINAFALPGGYVFVNRGAIEAADYEAELAAVMGHELSHVALRHGTNQATKAQYAQIGSGIMGIAGSIFGDTVGSMASTAGQLTAGGFLLKYSRSAETQADVMGTQLLYDSGYDPRAMAAFFEKLNGAQAPPEFFSDHPNPEHRVERVHEEIQKLGGALPDAQKDSPEFEAIKREVLALPVAAKSKPAAAGAAAAGFPKPGTVPMGVPSANTADLDVGFARLKYPDNWKKYGSGSNVTLAPDGGVVEPGNGQASLAYGVMASVAKLEGNPPAGQDALQAATEKLIESLRQENANMRVVRASKSVTLNGQAALSTYLSNDAPGEGQETDWLLTVMRPEGLAYFVCVAPRADYTTFSPTFASILDSVRFKQ